MKRIPISIQKIKVEGATMGVDHGLIRAEFVEYLFKLEEKGQQWEKTFTCNRDSLIELRSRIDKLIEETTTAEVLQINTEKADIIDEHYRTDKLCVDCKFKTTKKCITCLFELQSPLERKLYLELSKTHISFQTQYPLNWKGQKISIDGKTYGDSKNNFKEVLTVADFYVEKRNVRLCIYTDGFTYHERNEEQAQRDRNIDRKLQELGFQVLRYTGKDVNENTQKIINDISNWIS